MFIFYRNLLASTMIWPAMWIIFYLISEEKMWVTAKNQHPWTPVMHCYRGYTSVQSFNSIGYVEEVQTQRDKIWQICKRAASLRRSSVRQSVTTVRQSVRHNRPSVRPSQPSVSPSVTTVRPSVRHNLSGIRSKKNDSTMWINQTKIL